MDGDFTTIDLIAASTNALNGALLARRPDHYKNFTVVGILLMALLGGLGGGITRDILLGQVPSALTNPAYITLCLAFGVLGYLLAYAEGHALPGGAVPVHDLVLAALVRDRGGAERGRGRHPGARVHPARRDRPDRRPLADRRLVRCDAEAVHPWGMVRLDRGVDGRGLDRRHLGRRGDVAGRRHRLRRSDSPLRVIALYRAWEEPLAREPKGVYQHSDGRPMLGRQARGKSQREMHDLGLTVEDQPEQAAGAE